MKIHLPRALRALLMASFMAFPVSHANGIFSYEFKAEPYSSKKLGSAFLKDISLYEAVRVVGNQNIQEYTGEGGGINAYAVDMVFSLNGPTFFSGNRVELTGGDRYSHVANGGAIYNSTSGSIVFQANALPIEFEANKVKADAISVKQALGSAEGGAIFSRATTFEANASVSFEENVAEGSRFASGGAIKAGNLVIKNNVLVTFLGNKAVNMFTGTACGGAIRIETPYTSVLVEGNKSLFFGTNSAFSLQGLARGGAIDVSNKNGGTTYIKNDSLTFSDNYAQGAEAWGGAYSNMTSWGDSFKENDSLVFSGNHVTSIEILDSELSGGARGGAYAGSRGGFYVTNNGNVKFERNFSQSMLGAAYGGAVYQNAGSFEGNESLAFLENNVRGKELARGGAIYTHSDLKVIGNGQVIFSGNGAAAPDALGGAIYSKIGNIVVSGNDKVVFRANYLNRDGRFVLNAIHGEQNVILNLTAGAGGIEVYDSVQVENLRINRDLPSEKGLPNTVLFSGKHTLEDLSVIDPDFDPVLNQDWVDASRTIKAKYANLYAGVLKLEQFTLEATGERIGIQGKGSLQVDRATILAHQGMMFSSEADCRMQGMNDIRTAEGKGQVNFQEKNTMSFTLLPEHGNKAQLSITGSLYLGSSLSLTLLGDAGVLESGDYKLISSTGEIRLGSRFFENLSVQGLGIDSTDQIFIANNTLYFRYESDAPPAPGHVWKDGEMIDGVVFNNGDSVYFENSGVIEVSGPVEADVVLVSGDRNTSFLSAEGGGNIVSGSLHKEGSGVLTVNTKNSYSGDTILREGGLVATADNAFGQGSVLRIEGTDTYVRFLNKEKGVLRHSGDMIVAAGARTSILTGSETKVMVAGGLRNEGEVSISGEFEFSGDLVLRSLTSVGSGTNLTAASYDLGSSSLSLGNEATLSGDMTALTGGSLLINGRDVVLNGRFSIQTSPEMPTELYVFNFNVDDEMASVSYGQAPLLSLPGGLSLGDDARLGILIDLRPMSVMPSALKTAFFSDLVDEGTRDAISGSDVTLIVDRDGWNVTMTGDLFAQLTGQEEFRWKKDEEGEGGGDEPSLVESSPRGVGEVALNSLWNTSLTLIGFSNTVRDHSRTVPIGAGGARRVWVSSVNVFHDLENDGRMAGNEYRTNGYAVGGEFDLSQDWLMGASFAQSLGKTTLNSGMGSYDQDMIMAGLYAKGLLCKSKEQALSLDIFVGYAGSSNDGHLSSPDLPGSRYMGSWDDNGWMVDCQLQWIYRLSDTVSASLFAGVQYVSTTQEDFSMRAEDHGFSYRDASMSMIRLPIGGAVSATVYERNEQKLSIYGNAALLADVGRDDPSVLVSGETRQWRAEGSNPGTVSLQAGTGLVFEIGSDWSVSAGYQFESASRFTSHTCRAHVSYSF